MPGRRERVQNGNKEKELGTVAGESRWVPGAGTWEAGPSWLCQVGGASLRLTPLLLSQTGVCCF